MSRPRILLALSWAAGLVLAGTFLYAAAPKILHPDLFGQSIYRYQVLPHAGVSLMAIYLPWLEFTAALFLLWPRFRSAAALLIIAMLLMFLVAETSALARGLEISCGCFSQSSAEKNIGPANLLRNAALLALAIALPFLHARSCRAAQ